MTKFSKIMVLSFVFTGSLSQAARLGTTSGGGTFGPESQVQCAYSDNRGYELQVNLVGEPPTLGEYTANVQESSLNGFYGPLTFTKVSRMMPSDTVIEYKGNGFKLAVDLESGTDIPNQFSGVVQSKDIAGNKPVAVDCLLSY
jgi:hypothetical protein